MLWFLVFLQVAFKSELVVTLVAFKRLVIDMYIVMNHKVLAPTENLVTNVTIFIFKQALVLRNITVCLLVSTFQFSYLWFLLWWSLCYMTWATLLGFQWEILTAVFMFGFFFFVIKTEFVILNFQFFNWLCFICCWRIWLCVHKAEFFLKDELLWWKINCQNNWTESLCFNVRIFTCVVIEL